MSARTTPEQRARLGRWINLCEGCGSQATDTLAGLRALLADAEALAAAEREIADGRKLAGKLSEALGDSAEAVIALRAQVAKLREALEECEDYFDQRMDADVVGDPPHYQGNAAMALWVRVRDALAATSAPDQRESEGGKG